MEILNCINIDTTIGDGKGMNMLNLIGGDKVMQIISPNVGETHEAEEQSHSGLSRWTPSVAEASSQKAATTSMSSRLAVKTRQTASSDSRVRRSRDGSFLRDLSQTHRGHVLHAEGRFQMLRQHVRHVL